MHGVNNKFHRWIKYAQGIKYWKPYLNLNPSFRTKAFTSLYNTYIVTYTLLLGLR